MYAVVLLNMSMQCQQLLPDVKVDAGPTGVLLRGHHIERFAQRRQCESIESRNESFLDTTCSQFRDPGATVIARLRCAGTVWSSESSRITFDIGSTLIVLAGRLRFPLVALVPLTHSSHCHWLLPPAPEIRRTVIGNPNRWPSVQGSGT